MFCFCLCLSRSSVAVWMGRYRGRWRRFVRRGTVDRSGTWWLWTRNWGLTTDIPYTVTEELHPKAPCPQRTGGWTVTNWPSSLIEHWGDETESKSSSIRGHRADEHHYPNAMNHAGHAHTYSGPPPSALAAQMSAGHAAARGGGELEGRGRAMMAYQGGTLGRSHHHQQVPLPPPPTEAMNGGSMALPPVDYR